MRRSSLATPTAERGSLAISCSSPASFSASPDCSCWPARCALRLPPGCTRWCGSCGDCGYLGSRASRGRSCTQAGGRRLGRRTARRGGDSLWQRRNGAVDGLGGAELLLRRVRPDPGPAGRRRSGQPPVWRLDRVGGRGGGFALPGDWNRRRVPGLETEFYKLSSVAYQLLVLVFIVGIVIAEVRPRARPRCEGAMNGPCQHLDLAVTPELDGVASGSRLDIWIWVLT